ncbi:MAG: dienelactone hydrolase family protein [Pseudomonadota bacterium]|nr:dienelactone hydrolase family protein [Pseudomonadota bacterium]
MSVTTRIVDYEQGGQTYEGFLAMPAGAPKGVVLVAHAWGGQSEFERNKAKLLAEWGYAGFAIDVYGKGKRGETNEECETLMTPLASNREELQSRLAFALDVAKKEVGVDRAAAIGFCFGGLSVLDMARKNMDVAGVVSFHGLFGAPGNTDDKIAPKVLALHGWEDPMATPDDVMDFSREMTAANADWQLHAYGATMHAFTNPAAANPDFGTVYDAGADRRSFAACQDFLAEVLS